MLHSHILMNYTFERENGNQDIGTIELYCMRNLGSRKIVYRFVVNTEMHGQYIYT